MWAGAVYQLPSIVAPALIYLWDEVRTKRVKAVGLRGRWSKSLAILLHVRFFSRFVALSRSAVPSPAQHTRPSVTRSASCVVVSRLGLEAGDARQLLQQVATCLQQPSIVKQQR